MVDFKTVKAAASGRWPEIWPARGVGNLPRPGRHGPCPGCGGRDRFRLLPEDTDKGAWICGQGGEPTGGDGFSLLVHCGIAGSPGEALRLVAAYLGMDTKADPKARQRAREAAQRRERERLEVALAHELRVLLIVLDNRIADRELAGSQRFRESRPEWRPLPPDAWERERIAARRLAALLDKLYPDDKRSAAA